MKHAWHTWWLIYASCALVVAVALLVVTVAVLRLEQREFAARAAARHQSDLRIALWRMDSWLAPQLAQESARPYFEYAPYYAPDRAYTRLLSEIQPKEVQTPSPLLTYESEFFPLHFQVDPAGVFSSPQVPTGNQRDLAEATLISGTRIEEKAALLARLQQQVTPARIAGCTIEGMTQLAAQLNLSNELNALPPILPPPQQAQTDAGPEVWTAQSKQQTLDEYVKRAQTSNEAQQAQNFVSPLGDSVEVGPFAPAWVAVDAGALDEMACEQRLLVFVRRVVVSGAELYQGLIADWPRIRDRLLQEVGDLFPEAQLRPLSNDEIDLSADGMRMAIVPVALSAPPPPDAPRMALTDVTPIRATLGLVWLAAIIAVLATGITLRSSISYGERRHRFASAVTHELRTPLTTFRMYSEMLAENMVSDEAKRTEYLRALRTESNRLSALVENVLAYARLEQGRAAGHLETIAANDLLERIRPALQRRSDESSLDLDVQENASAGDASVEVDVEAVGQIMLNLVDNVCKYANDGGDGRATIELARENGQVRFSVADEGPGVPADLRRAIFQPFDRGTRQPGDTTPGVGLGLALSRGLARQMGGDLTVDTPPQRTGARFTLSIPIRE